MTKITVTIIFVVSMLYFAAGTRDFMTGMRLLHAAQIERAVDGR